MKHFTVHECCQGSGHTPKEMNDAVKEFNPNARILGILTEARDLYQAMYDTADRPWQRGALCIQSFGGDCIVFGSVNRIKYDVANECWDFVEGLDWFEVEFYRIVTIEGTSLLNQAHFPR